MKKLVSLLLAILCMSLLVQCSGNIASKEEELIRYQGIISEFEDIVKSNTISGYNIDDINDSNQHGINFNTYVTVMNSNKDIENGQVYYNILAENGKEHLEFVYDVKMTLRIKEFKLDLFKATSSHLDKIISEFEPSLSKSDVIEKISTVVSNKDLPASLIELENGLLEIYLQPSYFPGETNIQMTYRQTPYLVK